ncbi:MAG TPA: helical backbone metal receptor, partial [Accumulibacter sp.]|nr:helical backbone metal receptor [Accumulibacter sp.]
MQWSDAIGKHHRRYPGKPRIVSLVPSLTELLVALGLAELLVGRTGFCIHPRQVVGRLPKLGGTKGFDVDKLRALQPTHVLVNIDENRREEVEPLRDFVPHLIVTHPLAARDNLELYRLL